MDIDYLLSLQSLRSITHQVFNSLFLFTTTFGEDFIIMSLISGILVCPQTVCLIPSLQFPPGKLYKPGY